MGQLVCGRSLHAERRIRITNPDSRVQVRPEYYFDDFFRLFDGDPKCRSRALCISHRSDQIEPKECVSRAPYLPWVEWRGVASGKQRFADERA